MIDFLLENRIQVIAVVGSFFMLGFIIELIRRKRLKEEYSLLWLFIGLIFFVLSLWRKGLEYFADLIGVKYPPAALLTILVLGIFTILLHYSTVISRLSEKNKSIIQELSLLKFEFEKLKKNQEKK